MRGLTNLGGTCYLNTAVLALAPLCWGFASERHKSTQACKMIHSILHLVLSGGDLAVDSTPLFAALRAESDFFRDPWVQCDAHDTLLRLLDMLGPPPAFVGRSRTVIRQAGKRRTGEAHDYTVISVPVQECATIRDCLGAAFRKESVDVEGGQAQLYTRMESLPDVLILHLNRFDDTTYRRLNTLITYDKQFELRTSRLSKSYALYYICLHVGDIDTGHYITVLKSGGEWYCVNDDKVHRVDEAADLFALNEAYMLGYLREDATV